MSSERGGSEQETCEACGAQVEAQNCWIGVSEAARFGVLTAVSHTYEILNATPKTETQAEHLSLLLSSSLWGWRIPGDLDLTPDRVILPGAWLPMQAPALDPPTTTPFFLMKVDGHLFQHWAGNCIGITAILAILFAGKWPTHSKGM